MSSKKKQKIVSKDDLRKLMKEKTYSFKSQLKKIEHPFAKYNSLGQLTCVLCKSVVKSDALWVPHLQNRQHKENVEAFKTPGPAAPKRKFPPEPDITNKKFKDNGSSSKVSGSPSDLHDNTHKRSALKLAEYSSDDEEETCDNKSQSSSLKTVSRSQLSHPELPLDFFDSGNKPEHNTVPKTMSEILPEGFFDNPVQDAKVRQVEYKDKMEEEWEVFQKVMKEETHVSEAIVEEEDEQINVERNIEEIDDQINRWKEVNDLTIKKEEVHHFTDNTRKSDSESDSDIDLEDFLDWRSKKLQ